MTRKCNWGHDFAAHVNTHSHRTLYGIAGVTAQSAYLLAYPWRIICCCLTHMHMCTHTRMHTHTHTGVHACIHAFYIDLHCTPTWIRAHTHTTQFQCSRISAVTYISTHTAFLIKVSVHRAPAAPIMSTTLLSRIDWSWVHRCWLLFY